MIYINLKKIKKIIVSEKIKIIEAINNLNKSGLKIILVVNQKNKFKGIITDSDLRRNLINIRDLKDSISKIINRSPLISNSINTLEFIKDKTESKNIDSIPVVVNSKIKGIWIKKKTKKLNKFKNLNINTKVVIMAGGYGRRLAPLTNKTPKAMLKYKNKLLLQYIIENCFEFGFDDLIISVYYLKNKIKRYFKNGSSFGVNIHYLEENTPLGTIGSLKLLKNITDDFIVMNCDVISNVNLSNLLKFHKKNRADITIGIKRFVYNNPYGVINSKGIKFISFDEKPSINFNINAGIYVFSTTIIDIIKKNNIRDVNSLINYASSHNYRIFLFYIYESWLDLGSDKKIFSLSNV
jgi:hypothetical protein